MIRKAEERDASSLAAVSIEVWVNTYLRDGISPVFADYVLAEFTAQKFRNAIGDPDMAIWVSENRTGIDGFVKVCSTAAPPLADCSPLEITTLYVQPRHQAGGKGGALLRHALDHCRSIGGENAWLTVEAENRRAIDFYLRHGFTRIGSTDFVIADQGLRKLCDESRPSEFAGLIRDGMGKGAKPTSGFPEPSSIPCGSRCAPSAR